MACSLQGLIRFQSTWREIAEGMGLVSKRVRSSYPDYAAKVRERTLVDSLPELRTAAQRLQSLITDTRQYTGAVSLDISHGSMASRTAEGFYKTLINGSDYLCDYFVHIGEDELLDLVKVKALNWDVHARRVLWPHNREDSREQSNLFGIYQARGN